MFTNIGLALVSALLTTTSISLSDVIDALDGCLTALDTMKRLDGAMMKEFADKFDIIEVTPIVTLDYEV